MRTDDVKRRRRDVQIQDGAIPRGGLVIKRGTGQAVQVEVAGLPPFYIVFEDVARGQAVVRVAGARREDVRVTRVEVVQG